MLTSKEYREDLIKFTDKLRYKPQSFPKDEDGNPTETYLEYISMMYDPEIIKIYKLNTPFLYIFFYLFLPV